MRGNELRMETGAAATEEEATIPMRGNKLYYSFDGTGEMGGYDPHEG